MNCQMTGFHAKSMLGVVSDGPGAELAQSESMALENSSNVITQSTSLCIAALVSVKALVVHTLRRPC